MKQEMYIPTSADRATSIERISRVLTSLPLARYRVTVEDAKPKRSDPQNRYLWSIYQTIIEKGGESMGGWTKDDLHEFFLISHFGGDVKELFGKKRIKPLRRSSRLNKQEFSEFVAFIQQFMAERGVYIADSGEPHL